MTINNNYTFNSNKVRVEGEYSDSWFFLDDLCKILIISDVKKKRYLKFIPKEWRKTSNGVTRLSDAGVSALLAISNKPTDKYFEKWFHSLLNEFRKNINAKPRPKPVEQPVEVLKTEVVVSKPKIIEDDPDEYIPNIFDDDDW